MICYTLGRELLPKLKKVILYQKLDEEKVDSEFKRLLLDNDEYKKMSIASNSMVMVLHQKG